MKDFRMKDADAMITQLPKQSRSETHGEIKVQVVLVGGDVHLVDTHVTATVCDLKAAIHTQLGHSSWQQKLVLGENILADGSAVLQTVGVAHNSMLTLLISGEPIGQSSLAEPNGKKTFNIKDKPSNVLTEFELQSWRTAKASNAVWDAREDEASCEAAYGNHWGNLGCWGPDFYWTTRSDGCRYEYWSTAPGDNENGILVRVDGTSMRAIAQGSDDGLGLLKECAEEFGDHDALGELFDEGWPLSRLWKRDEDDSDSDEDDEDDN